MIQDSYIQQAARNPELAALLMQQQQMAALLGGPAGPAAIHGGQQSFLPTDFESLPPEQKLAVLQHQMFERSNKVGAGFAPGKDDDDCEGEDDASDDEEEYAEEDDDELEESEEEEEEEDDDDDDDDSINNDELQLAVDRTILQDQAMLAGTKIAA